MISGSKISFVQTIDGKYNTNLAIGTPLSHRVSVRVYQTLQSLARHAYWL